MPPDEGAGLDDHQCHPPVEKSAQDGHQPSGGVFGTARLDPALLKHGQLFSQEEVFGRQCTMGASGQKGELGEIEKDGGYRAKTVFQCGKADG